MAKTVVGWKIWYDDGSKYSSKDIDWADLPVDGVQYLMLYESTFDHHDPPQRTRMSHSGQDHYFRQETEHGVVYGSNNDSKEQNEERYPGAVVLKGRWADSDFYENIIVEAMADYDF